jgi:[ribosomal protein S5]-alanine N-acetyltransferase
MKSTLHTARLLLRLFTRADLDEMSALMANPDFMRFSTGPYSRGQTAAFLDKIIGWGEAGLPSQFAVSMPPSPDVLGYCGFFHHAVDGIQEIEIGYRLHPDHWNQGLATEAARAVRDHGFGNLNLPRLISLIHVENAPSRRVAEKNGMLLEKETVFRGFPAQVFAISRAQWQAQRAA